MHIVIRFSTFIGALFLFFSGCGPTVIDDGCIPKEEECNGEDDDCDEEIDEDEFGDYLTRDCYTICSVGFETCEDGHWAYCTAIQPVREICDGVDNDCNGAIDEVCACRHGDTRACGAIVGVCGLGIQYCDHGEWEDCQLPYDPSDLIEICDDGLDNDCDEEIDEDECRIDMK